MADNTATALSAERMLSEYRNYDRAVDVVSIFHWLFTETIDVPRSVEHFERYPRIPLEDGVPLKPDFTVAMKDGRGIVGEIARIGLHDNSVEKLCRQLLKYSVLDRLPVADGYRELDPIDVMYLCPFSLIEDAARRILDERLAADGHWYKPSRIPAIYTFAAEADRYTITRWPHGRNGVLTVSEQHKGFAEFPSLNVRPSMFARNKVQYAFINDGADPLYLATRLWMNVFPAVFGRNRSFDVRTLDIVQWLRDSYGFGIASDVRLAMKLLVSARVASAIATDTWRVTRIHITRGRQLEHEALAERACMRNTPDRSRRRAPERGVTQEALFALTPPLAPSTSHHPPPA